jgi:hypothetical protein
VIVELKETFGNRFEFSHLSLSVDMMEMQDYIAPILHHIYINEVYRDE